MVFAVPGVVSGPAMRRFLSRVPVSSGGINIQAERSFMRQHAGGAWREMCPDLTFESLRTSDE